MPQRISSFDTSPMTGFFFAMGSMATYFGVSGPQVLGAIIGSVFFVTTMRNERPVVKCLNLLGSFFLGILGTHFVAGLIAGLPYMPATVTPESAIGVGAVISAACGIIVLRRIHRAAKSKSIEDVQKAGRRHND